MPDLHLDFAKFKDKNLIHILNVLGMHKDSIITQMHHFKLLNLGFHCLRHCTEHA